MSRAGGKFGNNMKRRPRMTRSSAGAQLLEFAFALPILLLLVAGIWDFGSALVMKQKLTNAAREGARIVVSTPATGPVGANCASSATPCAIQSAADAVQQYLTNAGLDASWITPSSASTPTTCEWTYQSNSNPNFKLDIVANALISGNGIPSPGLPATQVTLTWPLQWSLKGLLPSSLFPPKVSATVTMPNLDGGC